MEVAQAASDYVDVLSFQDFRDPVTHLKYWHEETGMPVLWADGSRGHKDDASLLRRNDGQRWCQQVLRLLENPGCVGAHLCGAFIANRVRKSGLLFEDESPDVEMIKRFIRGNRDVADAFAAIVR